MSDKNIFNAIIYFFAFLYFFCGIIVDVKGKRDELSLYRHRNDVKEPTRIIRQGSALSFTPFFKLEEAMCLQKHGFFFCLALKGKGRGSCIHFRYLSLARQHGENSKFPNVFSCTPRSKLSFSPVKAKPCLAFLSVIPKRLGHFPTLQESFNFRKLFQKCAIIYM